MSTGNVMCKLSLLRFLTYVQRSRTFSLTVSEVRYSQLSSNWRHQTPTDSKLSMFDLLTLGYHLMLPLRKLSLLCFLESQLTSIHKALLGE